MPGQLGRSPGSGRAGAGAVGGVGLRWERLNRSRDTLSPCLQQHPPAPARQVRAPSLKPRQNHQSWSASGLAALFSSCVHITVAGRSLQIQQQWGIPCIAASVAEGYATGLRRQPVCFWNPGRRCCYHRESLPEMRSEFMPPSRVQKGGRSSGDVPPPERVREFLISLAARSERWRNCSPRSRECLLYS